MMTSLTIVLLVAVVFLLAGIARLLYLLNR